MKAKKIISICLVSIVIAFGTFKLSKSIIDDRDFHYVQVNPLVAKEHQGDQAYLEDIDNITSHGMNGGGEITLPVKYDKDYIIYEDSLYVTNNNGRTWMEIPNADYLGYARISENHGTISSSNLYISNQKVAIVYGGRGPENISIIRTDNQGEIWSMGTISMTATHDLEKGYEKLYIDFLDDDSTGYLVAIRNKEVGRENYLVYRSVNTGVTWDNVDTEEELYGEIMTQFGL